jgi:hypothetical protein
MSSVSVTSPLFADRLVAGMNHDDLARGHPRTRSVPPSVVVVIPSPSSEIWKPGSRRRVPISRSCPSSRFVALGNLGGDRLGLLLRSRTPNSI